VFTSPFEKGGFRGIYFKNLPLTPLFQRGGLNGYEKSGCFVEKMYCRKLFVSFVVSVDFFNIY
jgi:hypothetical protein